MKRFFEYQDDHSSKFWSIETEGFQLTVSYGRTGTTGQTQVKEFKDETVCLKTAEKLIAEKTRKGYTEKTGSDTQPESGTPSEPRRNGIRRRPPGSRRPGRKASTAGITDTDTGETEKNITLYFRSGNSDKVYHAELKAADDGYIVNASWGRRGSTMQTAAKTVAPLAFAKAKAIYDKIVAEKMSKGYSTSEEGFLYADTSNSGRVSGLLPQLLNIIDEDMLSRLLEDPDYCAQPKHDGERRMIKDSKTGVNRKGLTVTLPEEMTAALEQSVQGIADLDGEMESDRYTIFDILSLDGEDLRKLPYAERLEILKKQVTPNGPVALVETAYSPEEKSMLYERLKATNQEGIVFKYMKAPYTHGRPNSGGTQLKFKFCASATVFVISPNAGKRSILMGINDQAGNTREIGSVTIPVNFEVPEAGDIIEVRYLYAYPQGSLYQPVYAGIRPDMDITDCNISQLKYKAGLAE